MANGDNPNLAYAPRGGALGTATAFNDTGEYSVSSLSYPNDIMSEQYGGNYVIFYVNVHEDSVLYKGQKDKFVSGELSAGQRGELAGAKYSDATVAGTAVVAGAGAAQATNVGGKAVNALGLNSKPAETVANLTAGSMGGAAVVSAIGGVNKQYKRMKQAIALHIPTDLSIRYSADWEAESTAAVQAAMSAAENLARGNLKNSVGAGASYLAGAAMRYTPEVGNVLSKSSGTAANPKKEQLFKQVDFRTFTFSYQFFPRSAEEAKNVRDIIKAFKLHMHPEYRDANHFLWIYPSEFDIYYYNNHKENMNLHRHTSCVLTDLNVSYSPQGTFTTFADGMPTQINVQMTFKELALLSKETIQDGF